MSTGGSESKKFDPRISTKYVIDPVSDNAMEKATKIMRKLGEGAHSFNWAPNWNFDGMRHRPSGYTLRMDPSARVCSDLVDPLKWFTGTALYNLGSDVRLTDGTPLTEEKIKTNVDEIYQYNVANNVPDVVDPENSLDASYFMSANAKQDVLAPGKYPWLPALGTGSGFATLYVSNTAQNNYKFETNFWLAVHAGPQAFSENINSLIEEFEREERTMKELVSHPYMKTYGMQAGMRNRSRLLASLARSFNIQLDKLEVDERASSRVAADKRYNFEKLTPHIETVTNLFEETEGGRLITLYNNTVNPSWSQRIAFTNNPYRGITVLSGRVVPGPDGSKKSGVIRTWEATPDAAFPVSTGRPKTIAQIKKDTSPEMVSRQLAEARKYARFIFTGNDFSTHYKLLDGVYRERNHEFVQKQREMGYGAWLAPNEPLSEIELRPVVVKLAGSS